jgi:hypothetical protein
MLSFLVSEFSKRRFQGLLSPKWAVSEKPFLQSKDHTVNVVHADPLFFFLVSCLYVFFIHINILALFMYFFLCLVGFLLLFRVLLS